VVDGHLNKKYFNNVAESFKTDLLGQGWKEGDVIGVAADLDNYIFHIAVNGAYKVVYNMDGFRPIGGIFPIVSADCGIINIRLGHLLNDPNGFVQNRPPRALPEQQQSSSSNDVVPSQSEPQPQQQVFKYGPPHTGYISYFDAQDQAEQEKATEFVNACAQSAQTQNVPDRRKAPRLSIGGAGIAPMPGGGTGVSIPLTRKVSVIMSQAAPMVRTTPRFQPPPPPRRRHHRHHRLPPYCRRNVW
jgi:hypothetical protein